MVWKWSSKRHATCMYLVRVVTAINVPCIGLKLTDLPLFSNLSISPCKMCVIDGLVGKFKCSLICVTIIKCDVTVTAAAKLYTCIIEGFLRWMFGGEGGGWDGENLLMLTFSAWRMVSSVVDVRFVKFTCFVRFAVITSKELTILVCVWVCVCVSVCAWESVCSACVCTNSGSNLRIVQLYTTWSHLGIPVASNGD